MTDTKTTVRFPAELLTRLRKAAEHDHRSVNQQVIAYVERGLDQDAAGTSKREQS